MSAVAVRAAGRGAAFASTVGVREAAGPDRLLDSLLHLSAAADRRGRALLVQQPGGQLQLHLARLHVEQLALLERRPGIQSAIILSLEIGLIASLVATALGTMIALALVRYKFRTRAATNILIFLPLSTPEIVLGASLLTLFLIFTLCRSASGRS
jgi:ABC-type glycerol-3-phosphate transport system permease component